ncbi:unnamed protein product [Prorocentrum cordatum]|uniref:Uncharacterized protein n=1 Tax=Prorocentrum cordatum TaxID=2364126 RepID=A0ABN9YGS7_9DINO|nr:unnamed protein product [Polarella glacialis]
MLSSGGITVLVVFLIRPCSSQGGTCHANCGTGSWPSLSTDWSIECGANPYCMFGCPECFTTTSETSSTTWSSATVTATTTSESSSTTRSTTSGSSTTVTSTTVSTTSESSSTTVSLTTGTSATVSTTSESSRTTQSTTSVSSTTGTVTTESATTGTVTTVSTSSESSGTTVSITTGTSATGSTTSESSRTTQSTTVSLTTSSPTSSSTVSESTSTTVSSTISTTGSQSSSTTVSLTTSSPTSSSTVSESTSTTASSTTLTTGSQSSSTTMSSTTSSTISSSTTSESSSKTVSSTTPSLTSSSTRSGSSTTTASSSSTTASATTRSTTSESSTTSTTVHVGPWWQQRGVLLLMLLSVAVAVMVTFAGLWQSILRAECPYSDGTPELRHTCLSAWDAHAAGTLPDHTRLSSAAIRVACCLSGVEVGREELAGRPLAEGLGLLATLKCLSLLVLADAGVTGVDLQRLGRRAAEADPKSGAGRIGERLRRALRALERGERLAMGLGLEARLWDLFYSLHPVLGLWVHCLGNGGLWLRRAVASAAGLFASLACCALLLLAWAEGPVIAPCMLSDAGLWQELDLQTVLGDCGIAALGGLAVPVVTAALVRAGGVFASVVLLIGSVLVVLAFLANVCMVDVDHWIVALFAQLALCWPLAPAAQVALCHAVCAHAAGRRPAVLLGALRCLRLAIAPGAAEKPSVARDAAQGSTPGGVHISWAKPPPGGSPMESVLRASAGILLEAPPRAPALCPFHAEAPDPPGRSAPSPDLPANPRPRLPLPVWGAAPAGAPGGRAFEPMQQPSGARGA